MHFPVRRVCISTPLPTHSLLLTLELYLLAFPGSFFFEGRLLAVMDVFYFLNVLATSAMAFPLAPRACPATASYVGKVRCAEHSHDAAHRSFRQRTI